MANVLTNAGRAVLSSRLSGGSKATSLCQIVSVLCSTTAGQILEEEARVTLLS